MRFASLGSGSKGNATIVASDGNLLLIDCGFSLRELRKRMSRIGLEPEQLTGVLVTHEHGDHVGGVGAVARAMDLPVYLTDGTLRASRDLYGVSARLISPHRHFAIDSLDVEPVAVPHDAREPCQFVLSNGDCRLGILTDLGSITSHVVDSYRHCNALLLECNHDSDMLIEGPYPAALKERVGGDWGHLNNAQSAELIGSLSAGEMDHLVVGHVSQQNNTGDLALAAVEGALDRKTRITLADQDYGFGWIDLN